MSQRVAIVTGSSRGIGRACAESLIGNGFFVVGCSDTSDEALISNANYRHETVDAAQPSQLESFVLNAADQFGRLDALINNVGTHPPTASIDDMTIEDFDQLLSINLRSAFVACKTAIPMLRNSAGAIVNMGSTVGLYGQEGAVTYCATKAAISGLTKALAIDEARHGVRVNCVCPGTILTSLAREVHPPERIKVIADWSWSERWGEPAEVGDLVAFLVGDHSRYITGQDIVIGGGSELGFGFKGSAYYGAMGMTPVGPRVVENGS